MKRGVQDSPAPQATRDRLRYWAQRKAGICVDCRQKHPGTTARCVNCLHTRSQRAKPKQPRAIPDPPPPPERLPRERRFVSIYEPGRGRVEMEVVWP